MGTRRLALNHVFDSERLELKKQVSNMRRHVEVRMIGRTRLKPHYIYNMIEGGMLSSFSYFIQSATDSRFIKWTFADHLIMGQEGQWAKTLFYSGDSPIIVGSVVDHIAC